MPLALRLSEWLGVTADRAERIFLGALRWRVEGTADTTSWDVRLGRHIRFAGSVQLDDRLKGQVVRMLGERLMLILDAADDALCMSGDGNAAPAKAVRGDLDRWMRANGTECPCCGAALLDWEPDSVLYSAPLQMRVHCVECGHAGYRVFVTPNV